MAQMDCPPPRLGLALQRRIRHKRAAEELAVGDGAKEANVVQAVDRPLAAINSDCGDLADEPRSLEFVPDAGDHAILLNGVAA
jgi:hypothetical protein